MSQKKSAQHSSGKDKKQLRPFRFGLHLDQLPCTYLPDFGNVATFLVETGEVIQRDVEVEGLFRKSVELSRQDELKLQAERGEALGNLDVHEVTCLVKTFFRLLPEPLLPRLFHDPFLSSMDLPQPQRMEAVQGLCFALPAPHLSCLRFFMNLMAYVVSQVEMNRMNARNLAVVLTPSLIRLKARTKLMSPQEVRLLPKQTALIEHLICHADRIGCMTSQLYHHSIEMTEDLLQKKQSSKKRKKKSKLMGNLEERVGAARAALGIVASLHFRPNTSTTVSDTILVDGPYGQACSLQQNIDVNSESQLEGYSSVYREAHNTRKARLIVFPTNRQSKKHRPKSKKRRQNDSRHSKAPVEKCTCKAMLEPLIQSWSGAIPVINNCSDDDSDQATSEDSNWSDEDSCQSVSDEEEQTVAEDVTQIQDEHPLMATNKDKLGDAENFVTNESCGIKMEGDKIFSGDQENNDQHQQELEYSRKHGELAESIEYSDHSLINNGQRHHLSEKRHLDMGEENDHCRTLSTINTSSEVMPSQSKSIDMIPKISSQLILSFTDVLSFTQQLKENLNQENNGENQKTTECKFSSHASQSEFQQVSNHIDDEKEFESEKSDDNHQKHEKLHIARNESKTEDALHSVEENVDKTDIKAAQEDVQLSLSEQCKEDGTDSEKLNQHSESVQSQQLSSTSTLLPTPLQHHTGPSSPNEEVSTNLPSTPANKQRGQLLHLAQIYNAMEGEETESTAEPKNSTSKCTVNQELMFERIESEASDSTCLSETDQDHSVLKSKGSTSIQHEAKQHEQTLLHGSSVKCDSCRMTSSPIQTEKFLSDLDSPASDKLEPCWPDSGCLELADKQMFSCSIENVSQQLRNCLKHESCRDLRLEGFISQMHRPSVHYSEHRTDLSVSVHDQQPQLYTDTENFNLLLNHNLGDKLASELLHQRLSHKVRKSQNSFHLQEGDWPVRCDCCKMNSSRQENIYRKLPLPEQWHEPYQGHSNYSHHCHHCADVDLFRSYDPTEIYPQCMNQCFPCRSRSYTLPNSNLFHRMPYGFESLQQPPKHHHYGTNLLSRHAFAEERNSYRTEQYYGHLLNTVPIEEHNTPSFETYFSHRRIYPGSCSRSMMHESLEAFITREDHIQNENMMSKNDYDSRWILHERGGTCENINKKHQLNYVETNLQDLPRQTMCSRMRINEHSRNEWEFQNHEWGQNTFFQRNNACPNIYSRHWNQQNCLPLKQQEIRRKRNELNYEGFHALQDTDQYPQSNQYRASQAGITYNCNQQEKSTKINHTHDSVNLWNDSSIRDGASKIYDSCCPGNEGVVEYIKVLSENKNLWTENPVCNRANTVKQGEECSDNIGALPSSTEIPSVSTGTSGSPQTMDALDPTSKKTESTNVSDQQRCDSSGFHLPTHPHTQRQANCAPSWSPLNPNIPIPSSTHQFDLKSETPQSTQEPEFLPHHVALKSDMLCTAKAAADEPDEVNPSKLKENSCQRGEVCNQLFDEFKLNVDDTQDQMCATNIEKCIHESFLTKNEDQNEMTEHLKTQCKSENTYSEANFTVQDSAAQAIRLHHVSFTTKNEEKKEVTENLKTQFKSEVMYSEANFNVQDSAAQAISPHHLGDGQKGISPDTTMVVSLKSPRKNRRKSPGTKKAKNTQAILAMQELEKKEKSESLKEWLELISTQEKPQQDGHKDNPDFLEEKTLKIEHDVSMPQTISENSFNNSHPIKAETSPILKTPIEVCSTETLPLATVSTETVSRSNTNSSNTASDLPTFISQNLQPKQVCLRDIQETQCHPVCHLPNDYGVCGVLYPTMPFLQDNLLNTNSDHDFHGTSGYNKTENNFHQDTARKWLDTKTERRMKANSVSASQTGYHLDFSSSDQIIHHPEAVSSKLGNSHSVCSILDLSHKTEAVPRKAYFKPDGDIALK